MESGHSVAGIGGRPSAPPVAAGVRAGAVVVFEAAADASSTAAFAGVAGVAGALVGFATELTGVTSVAVNFG